MKKVIALVLILASFLAAYVGIEKLQDSTQGISIGDLEISAADSDGKTAAYMYLGGAAICLISGIYLLAKKN